MTAGGPDFRHRWQGGR